MRSRLPLGLVALALPLAVSACGDDGFGAYNQLDKLRVLAVQSEPPTIAPGQSAALSALVYTPDGQAPTYRWSWCPFVLPREKGFACAVTEEQLQAAADEAVGPGIVTVPSFDLGNSPTATLPYLADPLLLRAFCEEIAGNATAISALPRCESSFEVTVRLEVQTATDSVSTIKRVELPFAADAAKNGNPTLGALRAALGKKSVEADAALVPTDGSGRMTAGAPHRLWVDIPATSFETFIPSPDPAAPDVTPSAVRETHYLTWFVNAGETDTARTTFIDGEVALDVLRENVWTLPDAGEIPDGRASLILVLRDERGGVTWNRYDLATGEP